MTGARRKNNHVAGTEIESAAAVTLIYWGVVQLPQAFDPAAVLEDLEPAIADGLESCRHRGSAPSLTLALPRAMPSTS